MVKRMTFKQFLFILPLLMFIGVFSIYPIAVSFSYTFFDYMTNDQQHNGFYLSEQLNGKLFYEDCDYIIYFIDADKSVEGLSDEDIKAFEAIQMDTSKIMKRYQDTEGIKKVSKEEMNEVTAFIDDVEKRTMEIYGSNTELEFYNVENMPQIINDMRNCIVESNFTAFSGFMKLLLDIRFLRALGNTLLFTVISVALELVLGMVLALVMDKAIRGIGVVRTIALIPWAIPTAVSAMIWSYMYDGSYGVVSKIFESIGLIGKQSEMLLTSQGALASIVISDVWKTTPYMALLLLAGLQVVDRGLYESAAIDGSGPFKTFISITLPLIKPSILVALLFRTLDAFRVYDLIAILTGGGPGNGTESLSVYAYKLMFNQSNYGYGSVVVMGMTVCVALIAILYVKVLGADVISNN